MTHHGNEVLQGSQSEGQPDIQFVDQAKDLMLHGYDVFSDGRVKQLTLEDCEQAVPLDAYRWIHLDLNHAETKSWLQRYTDTIIASALTQEDTRPRCIAYQAGILLNLRGINLNTDSDPEDMVSIRMWIDERLIVSARRRHLMAAMSIREEFENGKAPKSANEFLQRLTYRLTNFMDDEIGQLSDRIDELESVSLESEDYTRRDIQELRRIVIKLRRYIAPQREALYRLCTETHALVGDKLRDSLRESVDRIIRMVEELDAIRERCAIISDQILEHRAEAMNRNMMVLSIVAAVFLPLGFMTGLLGVNIAGIPGAEYPHAFALFSLSMLLMAALLIGFFKWLKWL